MLVEDEQPMESVEKEEEKVEKMNVENLSEDTSKK